MTHLMLEIVGVWLVVILMGMPLFASMGLAAFAFVVFSSLSPSIVPQKMAQAMNSFPLVAAPLFILMGNLLGAAKLTDRIVNFATSLVGALRGGYAHASILSSMIFAGMVGSAVADAAGTGAVEVRAMKKAGYRPETAAAISAAAATFWWKKCCPLYAAYAPMVRNSPCAKFATRLTAYSSVNATADSARIAAVESPTPTVTRKVVMPSSGRLAMCRRQ